VRVHANDADAPAIGAQAFAHGNDVHFAPGKYDPSSREGRQLIAHEVTHVVQQGAAPKRGRAGTTETATGSVQAKDDRSGHLPAEQEADKVGRDVFDADEKTPVPGDKGVLTGEVVAKIDGKDVTLAAGTVVEVVGGRLAKLRVKVYSGHGGAEVELDGTKFKSQPNVSTDESKE
jgi:hypothetical protein